MEVLTTVEELRAWIDEREGASRVLIPTMGALHRGHTRLFDLAKEGSPDADTVATLFVNPTQFGPGEDFEAYPRQPTEDIALCESHGISAVFAPPASRMYEEDASVTVRESRLSQVLCGASRPGHFDGVCTVVAKLFLLTQPTAAVFGEKDYQQLAIIRRLVRDLNFPIRIVAGETVREKDGLALSSRNRYLTREEREQAPLVYRALRRVAEGIAAGEFPTPTEARRRLVRELESAPSVRIDYAEIVDSDTLHSLSEFGSSCPRLLAAVYFGRTRLIDNVGVSGFSGGKRTPGLPD